MNTFSNKLDQFLGKKIEQAQEKTLIEKKLVMEDGRELLREETPISHSNKTFLR